MKNGNAAWQISPMRLVSVMNRRGDGIRWALVVLLATLVVFGCSETASTKSFVGKWKSSKLMTPVYLYENGEWEIREDDGGVLQYGVWVLKGNTIIWTYKDGSQIGHDPNAVVSVTAQEFKVRERDSSITSFTRLSMDRPKQ